VINDDYGIGVVTDHSNKCEKTRESEMDILKYLGNEICCIIKSSYDISIQKLQQILKM
jgi:hypothetical protein